MDEMPTDGRLTLRKIRARYPNAYERWCPSDDAQLMAGYRDGRSVEDLSEEFGRQPSAIESGLAKLALRVLRASADVDASASASETPDRF
ncbi:hypothetical protein ACWDRB_21085 [Nonomuraea sp. NPDC003707]